jgi:hypothetical protein
MLYLAQVHKNEFLDQQQLRLLARQEGENFWAMIPEEAFILLGKNNPYDVPMGTSRRLDFSLCEKLLVLVELSPTGDIQRMEEATGWILHLIQTYLTTGITPDFLRQEADRAEQWRQSLTLQNQEIARRSLELEARREQIQALEESLKRDKNGYQKDEGVES